MGTHANKLNFGLGAWVKLGGSCLHREVRARQPGGHTWSPICTLKIMAHGGVCRQKLFLGRSCLYIQSEVLGHVRLCKALEERGANGGWVRETLPLGLAASRVAGLGCRWGAET